MRATGFLQIVAERRPDGKARSLSIARVTRKCPSNPLPGAILVRVAVEVPDVIADVQTIEAAADVGMTSIVLLDPADAG